MLGSKYFGCEVCFEGVDLDDTFGDLIFLRKDELKVFVDRYLCGKRVSGCLFEDVDYDGQGVIKVLIGDSKKMAVEFQFMLWRLGIESYIEEVCESDKVKYYVVYSDKYVSGNGKRWIRVREIEAFYGEFIGWNALPSRRIISYCESEKIKYEFINDKEKNIFKVILHRNKICIT